VADTARVPGLGAGLAGCVGRGGRDGLAATDADVEGVAEMLGDGETERRTEDGGTVLADGDAVTVTVAGMPEAADTGRSWCSR
jgi:hypothetical protein